MHTFQFLHLTSVHPKQKLLLSYDMHVCSTKHAKNKCIPSEQGPTYTTAMQPRQVMGFPSAIWQDTLSRGCCSPSLPCLTFSTRSIQVRLGLCSTVNLTSGRACTNAGPTRHTGSSKREFLKVLLCMLCSLGWRRSPGPATHQRRSALSRNLRCGVM